MIALLPLPSKPVGRGALVVSPTRASAGHRRTYAICVRMLGAEHLLADRQSAFVEWQCPLKVALGLNQAGKVVEACRRVGMLWAERLFSDRQGTLEERPCRFKVALVLKQAGKVIETCRS
jgi:hypothetical protein